METETRELPQITKTNNGPEASGVYEYVSASRLKTWLRCPLAFKLRYIDGIVTPSSPSLVLGKIVHRGLEHYYRHRKRGVNLYPTIVTDYIGRIWDEVVADEMLSFTTKDEERELQAKAENLLNTYIAHATDWPCQPLAVEERFQAPLIDPTTGENLGISLVGVVDLIADDGTGPVITDFKTAARSSKQIDVVHEVQLSCYSYLFRERTGQTEAGLAIESLIKNKTPKIEVHRFGPRQDTHFERLFTVIRAYLDSIDKMRFHMSPGLECSFCDFRDVACGNPDSLAIAA